MISLEHFDEIDMRVGTVTAVSLNKRARKPAYKITVDLGDELGIKNSSAPVSYTHLLEDLLHYYNRH